MFLISIRVSPQTAVYGQTDGTRSIGRHKKGWIDVGEDCVVMGLSLTMKSSPRLRKQPPTGYNECWMLPPESSVTPGSSITVSRDWCTRSYTGWTSPSESVTSWACWLAGVCSAKRQWKTESNCCILVATRRHLRSAARHQLTVPRHRLNTYGRRAFAVAGPMTSNALPIDLRDPSVSTAS